MGPQTFYTFFTSSLLPQTSFSGRCPLIRLFINANDNTMSRFTDINSKLAYMTRKASKLSRPELKAKRPFYLRDTVKGSRTEASISKTCTNEANAFFQCLEENDLLDAKCAKQLYALVKCDKSIRDLKEKRRTDYLEGNVVQGTLHSSAINKLLHKYPNDINKEGITIQENLLNQLDMNRVKPYPHKNKWNPNPKYGNGLTVPDE